MKYPGFLVFLFIVFVSGLHAQVWQPANGHFGWKKKSVLVTQSQKVLIGCDSGRVMVTGDEGYTWNVSMLPTLKSVRSLTQTSDGNIYAGVYAGGMYRSPDDGQTWIQINTPDSAVTQVCASPDGDVFMKGAFSSAYAFRSSDLGITWDTVFTDRQYNPESVMVSKVTGEIFLSTSVGLYISSDSGATWIFTDSTHGLLSVDRVMTSDTLYGSSWTGLFISLDDGATWNNAGLGNSLMDVLLCTEDGKVFYESSNGGQFGFSLDGGITWSVEYFPGALKGIGYNSSTTHFFVANDNTDGIPRYTFDGITTSITHYEYLYAGNGIYATNANKTFCDARDTIMYAGGFSSADAQIGGGFYRSTDNGANWNYIPGTSVSFPTCFLHASDTALLMGTTANGPLHSGIFRSTDNGLTWYQSGLSGSYIYCMVMSGTGKIITSTNTGNYSSTDQGQTWISTGGSAFAQICCNAATGILTAKSTTSGGIYYSTNDGLTWTASISGPTSGTYLGMNPATGTLFRAHQSSAIVRSTDGGITWNTSANGMPVNVYAKKVVGTSCGELFVSATDNILYHSTDDGINWSPLAFLSGISSLGINGSNTLIADTYYGPFGYQLTGNNSACSVVWPGDANDDHYANNVDLLSVGLYYGQTGPARSTVSNAWTPQVSTTWSNSQFNGADYKHADCNGDGVIDSNDTTAIITNYGYFHAARFSYSPETQTAVSARLVRLSNDTLAPGDTAVFALEIGTASAPATGFAGCAFSIWCDETIVDVAGLTTGYTVQSAPSWICIHPPQDSGRVDGATCRINQSDTSGVVRLAIFRLPVVASIFTPTTLLPDLQACTVVDAAGNYIPLSLSADSAVIVPGFNSIPELNPDQNNLLVYPNPASTAITITASGLQQNENVQLTITTSDGREVYTADYAAQGKVFQTSIDLDELNLAGGLYFVTCRSEEGILVSRFIISE